jgi:glutamate dehydrogenase
LRISAFGCSRKSRPRWPAARATSTTFRLELPGVDDVRRFDHGRAPVIEEAIACVLSGAAEDDEFNQLVLFAGLEPSAVVWLRAWFRYLRQTGSSFGLITVVDALRRAPAATRR